MITVKEWFENNKKRQDILKVYTAFSDNITINQLLELQPLMKMCNKKGFKTEIMHYMFDHLFEDAVKEELHMTVDEAKNSTDKEVKKVYRAIGQAYKTLIPKRLYYRAKNKEWFKKYMYELYDTISNGLQQPCNFYIFDKYSDFEEYCKIHDNLHDTCLWSVYMAKRAVYKQKGYSRKQIIEHLKDWLKGEV